jgi:hypothetical protein
MLVKVRVKRLELRSRKSYVVRNALQKFQTRLAANGIRICIISNKLGNLELQAGPFGLLIRQTFPCVQPNHVLLL